MSDARPRLLDLFCCEGGASMGYSRAGFEVFGVDLFRWRGPDGKLRGFRQERYPFPSAQCDAIEYVTEHGHRFDAIAASPPCQRHSAGTRARNREDYPDLVAPTRASLIAAGRPYVIENVEGAPLLDPLTLCGSEFNLTARDTDGSLLRLERHRIFESNVFLIGAGGCMHDTRVQVGGVYGAGSTTRAQAAKRGGGYTPPTHVRAALMGIDWMSGHGLSQAIPPAYTEFIGRQLLEVI